MDGTSLNLMEQVNNAFINLGINAEAVSYLVGPTFTKVAVRIPVSMRPKELVAKSEQIAMQLHNGHIPIIHPDYNDGTMSLELPNEQRRFVAAQDIFETDEWKKEAIKKVIPLLLGHTVENKLVVADLAQLPHLLVAGTTGSGKTVALKSMVEGIMSIYKEYSHIYKFVLIDPKSVEFSKYRSSPFTSIFADNVEGSIQVLRHLVTAMNYRLRELFPYVAKHFGGACTNYQEYLNIALRHEDLYMCLQPMNIIVIDELADLILTDKELEKPLCLLAQKGRAAGIHLVVATQRPSSEVVTGLIKANLPAKLCLRVSTKVDARVIFGSQSFGAEQLFGKGDMLFLSPDQSAPVRIQGPFIK
jgi:S-DNA-T family DNA segregation ATPase FtsK/SpoIIIE